MNIMKVEKINKATVTYSWSEFFAFLEKHKALLKYMKSLEQDKKNWGKTIAEWMETCPPKSWISSAFVWSHAPEGHNFWNTLDASWKAEVREVERQVRDIEDVEWVLLQ